MRREDLPSELEERVDRAIEAIPEIGENERLEEKDFVAIQSAITLGDAREPFFPKSQTSFVEFVRIAAGASAFAVINAGLG